MSDIQERRVGPSGPEGSYVGREPELTRLDEAFGAATSGRGSLVLVVGESAIGKTRLAEEFSLRVAIRGGQVEWARSVEEGAPPYWPWVQILRRSLRPFDRTTLETVLGTGAPWIAALVPEIATTTEQLPLDSDRARLLLFDAVMTALERVAERTPLLLVLDNLQDADPASLQLLHHLAGQLDRMRLLVVGCVREPNTLKEGALPAEHEHLRLTGLRGRDVKQLIETVGGRPAPDTLVERLYRLTQGHPYFLRELVRNLPEEAWHDTGKADLWLPGSVREPLRRRLEALSPQSRQALEVASVLGYEFSAAHLARIVGDDPLDLLKQLQEALDLSLLTLVADSPGHYAFTHALVRETIFEDLPAPRRIELHRRAGDTLEALHRADVDQHLGTLAYHYSRAALGGSADEAIDYGRRAGERALHLFAWEEAVLHFERALDLLLQQKGQSQSELREMLYLRLGEARWRSGDVQGSRDAYRQVAESASAREDAETLARAALGSGGQSGWFEFYFEDSLIELLEHALRALPKKDSPLRALVMSRLAAALAVMPCLERREALAREALAIAQRLDDPATLAHVKNRVLWATWDVYELTGRIRQVEEMGRLAEALDDRFLLAHVHALSAVHHLERGDGEAAEQEHEAFDEVAHDIGHPFLLWGSRVQEAERVLRAGRFEEVETLVHEAVRVGAVLGGANTLQVAAIQTLLLRWHQGRIAEVIPEAENMAKQYPYLPVTRAILGWVYAASGRIEEARRELHGLPSKNLGDQIPAMLRLALLWFTAEAAVLTREPELSRTLYDALRPYADRCALGLAAACFGPVSLSLGRLAGVLDRVEESTQLLEDALRRSERLGSPPWVARAKAALGEALLRRGRSADRQRAIELLKEALAAARKLGIPEVEANTAACLDTDRGAAGHAVPEPAAHHDESSYVFRKQGDFWTIAAEGHVTRLRDAKGLHYLAELLRRPGRNVHVLDLVRSRAATFPNGSNGNVLNLGDAGEILDARTKAAYGERLRELQEQIAEAETWNDDGRAGRLREEREFLMAELAGAVGLGGRDRKAASASERARLAVTKAIKGAINRIEKVHPVLGRHLRATVRTGSSCTYAPNPHRQVSWDI